MGKIRMGPPRPLVLFIREKAGVGHFIETGTFRGDTAAWAAGHFRNVTTIELSASYHTKAVERFATNARVEPLRGNSAQVLAGLLERIDEPALFWLDAHWSGLDTSGRENECPLLEEIALINASRVEHVVLVDDARLFCTPPPPPHRAEDWPDLLTTTLALADNGRRHVVLYDDVLVAVPSTLKPALVDFLREAASATARRPASWWRKLSGR